MYSRGPAAAGLKAPNSPLLTAQRMTDLALACQSPAMAARWWSGRTARITSKERRTCSQGLATAGLKLPNSSPLTAQRMTTLAAALLLPAAAARYWSGQSFTKLVQTAAKARHTYLSSPAAPGVSGSCDRQFGGALAIAVFGTRVAPLETLLAGHAGKPADRSRSSARDWRRRFVTSVSAPAGRESLSLVRRIDESGRILLDLGAKHGEAPRVQAVGIIEGALSSAWPVRAFAPRRRSDRAGGEKDESAKTALPTGAGRSQLHCECLRAFFDFDNLVRNETVSFPVD
jgi:hypothetical protein